MSKNRTREGGFTLTELLMVIVAAAILALIFLPVLSRVQERALRVACAANLRQIAFGQLVYAGDNNDRVLPVNGSQSAGSAVPNTLPDPGTNTSQGLYLFGKTNQVGSTIWNCPARYNNPYGGLPRHELTVNGYQWVIGYCYFGGLTNWNTDAGSFYSHSPVKLGASKPYWVLAADPLIALGSVSNPTWIGAYVNSPNGADARNQAVYDNCPPHLRGSNPAGANEAFADGSVTWRTAYTGSIKFYRFDYWPGANGNTEVYWAQDPSDFSSRLSANLPALMLH